MVRRPRIDLAGYHHIINRGINKVDVFNDSEDKVLYKVSRREKAIARVFTNPSNR